MSSADKPVRLLLVDDEVGYLEVLSKRLRVRGYDVSTASSGAEAIRLVRRQNFEAAVLDLKMEDMDGIDVLKVLKKMLPPLQVIMLTGHGSERAAREGLANGAFDYLIKPISLQILVERIDAAVEAAEGDVNDE
jgi:DNA-binding response OmpR family regulator